MKKKIMTNIQLYYGNRTKIFSRSDHSKTVFYAILIPEYLYYVDLFVNDANILETWEKKLNISWKKPKLRQNNYEK